ncbi:cornifin-B-like [Canis lupus dingo]|uniref:cornifin-B-like n=1 Tax=Canis lupus dingo TaxID=286419 RepID=UPI0020C344DB|nr:cornifin-B-like [Canis lupus dingo]
MPCCHAALRGLPPFHAAALPPCSPAALVGLQPCRPAAWLLSDPERPAALPQCFPAALPPCCPAALPLCFSAALLPCCPAALPPCEACSPVRCVTHPAFKVSEQTLDPDLTGRCLLRPPLTCSFVQMTITGQLFHGGHSGNSRRNFEDGVSTTGNLKTSFNGTSLYDSEIGKQHYHLFSEQIYMCL